MTTNNDQSASIVDRLTEATRHLEGIEAQNPVGKLHAIKVSTEAEPPGYFDQLLDEAFDRLDGISTDLRQRAEDLADIDAMP
jgi:hypothetical protein